MPRKTSLIGAALAAGLIAAPLVGVATTTAQAASCTHFAFRDLAYKFVVVGKQRTPHYLVLSVENIGTGSGRVFAQRECGPSSKSVSLRRGQVHTFKVYVGNGNPLVRIWTLGSPYNIPAGTYPSKKGAFTLSSDSSPYMHLTSTNTTGHRAVLNIAKGKPGAMLSYGTASNTIAPGGVAHLRALVPTHVIHVRGEWDWTNSTGTRHGRKVVLDAPMVRLNN